MATPGLSLVGFMEQNAAIAHLRSACIPNDPAEAALIAEWNAATARLGSAVQNAGAPDIRPMPASAAAHVDAVQQEIAKVWNSTAITIQLVEIDPLLAFQFTVDTDRSSHHCTPLSTPPTLQELLHICLPLTPSSEQFQMVQGPQSMLLKSRSLNVRTMMQGAFGQQFIGIMFGVALPFTHVVRHNGKCYLHNGFHRAYGARMAGATHMPCLVREVSTHDEVGIKTDGTTFPASLLESANPPTLAHFMPARAHAVMLRAVSRVLHVSWAEYAVPDEA